MPSGSRSDCRPKVLQREVREAKICGEWGWRWHLERDRQTEIESQREKDSQSDRVFTKRGKRSKNLRGVRMGGGTERQTDRQTDKQRQRQTDRESKRDRQSVRRRFSMVYMSLLFDEAFPKAPREEVFLKTISMLLQKYEGRLIIKFGTELLIFFMWCPDLAIFFIS